MTLAEKFNEAYPIHSVYFTHSKNLNPTNLFGGKWRRFTPIDFRLQMWERIELTKEDEVKQNERID